MSESGICDGPVNSNLYAIVNIDNKTKKTDSLLKRASNKSEIFIPEISGSLQELSNSDSNLYATLLSVEEIQVSLSCSRTLYGSVDDIITEQSFGDIDQTETTAGSYLMRHKSGPIRKVPPPPPAKPPPYQKGEPDIPQNSKEMILRRSKSANSRNRFKFDNRLPLKPETEDSKKSNNKIGIKSFRRHKEITEKSTSGLVVSTSTPLKPEDKTIAPVQLPFKKCPLTGIPQDLFLLPRKLSPPDAKKLTNKQSPPENNSKTTSPPIPLPFQNPLRPPPPTNPKPAHVPKPPLKLPIQPNPGNTPISSLPSMSLGSDPPVPPPTASKNIKHPNRLPPPPPSHSLTLPRNLVDKPNSLRRSPSIGDYTLLTPVSPESNSTFSPLTVDYPTFSPLTTNEPSSPTEELDPLITGEGYSVLNVNDCDNTVKDPGKKVNSFARTTSLPPLNSTAPINGVTTSRTKQEKLPPKKPPRRMTSSNLSPTALSNSSEYTILSSVDSEVALFIDKQNIMSTNANGVAPSNDTTKAESIRNLKTMTIASHGSRPVPPKPAAYRVRSKSQNLNNCLTTKSTPVEYTKSVEVSSDSKPVKQQVETTSEGLLSKMSKKFKNRTRAENTIPSISTPILDTSPHKVIGLNTSLVSECVAYLKQPKSLREEGLFRVPGDCNQVIMYLKQFDYSLKPNLEDELDPNNVSSLLKLHIRNNGGLLGKKEAGDMYAAVRQKNIEEIDSVIKTTSAAQQSILKEVLFLFKEVAEHEDENKMCSGAIATSCGLSIFPVVNAGNANLMLKVLIDNVEEIFQQ